MIRKILIFIIVAAVLPVLAYEIYTPETYKYEPLEKTILFILDFSNSMSDYLEHQKKSDMVKSMMQNILTNISSDTKIGLRVYGHTCSLLAFNACKSSELLVPISENNSGRIISEITKLHPKGMTPITYSLKQAVNKDFGNKIGMKRIVLLTDGGENCDESPCEYAITLVKTRRDINIDVIAFNVADSEDLAQLKCVADVTDGRFYEADTNAQLVNSMNELVLPHKQVEALLWGSN